MVNCILLGRAEAFASRNNVVDSILDGLGIGLGFSMALTMLGGLRELLGAGTVFGMMVYPDSFAPLVFVLAPGAFIVLGMMIALLNRIRKRC